MAPTRIAPSSSYTAILSKASVAAPRFALAASNTLILGQYSRTSEVRVLPSALCVQQPCSNLGKYSEMWRKAALDKYGDLQEICNLEKCPESYRQRLLISRFQVRVLGGSLLKGLQLHKKFTCDAKAVKKPNFSWPEPEDE